MKNIAYSISFLALAAFLFVSCGNSNKADLKTKNDSVAYVIGANIGRTCSRISPPTHWNSTPPL